MVNGFSSTYLSLNSTALLLLFLNLLAGSCSLVAAQQSSSSSSTGSSSGSSSSSTLSSSSSATSNSSASSSASSTSTALPSLSTYSSCVSTCFETAIGLVNCTSVVPESCYCNNTSFQPALVSCIQTSSCADQLSTAEDLTNKFCALASPSTSISFLVTSVSASPSSSPSSSSSGTGLTSSSGSGLTGTSSSGSTTSSNAAVGMVGFGGIDGLSMVRLGVAVVGVVIGALLVG